MDSILSGRVTALIHHAGYSVKLWPKTAGRLLDWMLITHGSDAVIRDAACSSFLHDSC